LERTGLTEKKAKTNARKGDVSAEDDTSGRGNQNRIGAMSCNAIRGLAGQMLNERKGKKENSEDAKKLAT